MWAGSSARRKRIKLWPVTLPLIFHIVILMPAVLTFTSTQLIGLILMDQSYSQLHLTRCSISDRETKGLCIGLTKMYRLGVKEMTDWGAIKLKITHSWSSTSAGKLLSNAIQRIHEDKCTMKTRMGRYKGLLYLSKFSPIKRIYTSISRDQVITLS